MISTLKSIVQNEYIYNQPPKFNLEIFEDIGNSICIALLDWIDKNPISRLPNSSFKSVEELRQEMGRSCNVNPKERTE